MADARHRVVIVGGGFGGLYTAQHLSREKVDITLIDQRNHHLFQPLLYQVATGGLSPANIAAPLRAVVKKQRNCTVLLGQVTGLDPVAKTVLTDLGPLPYDSVIFAAGATNNYFGHPEWEAFAPGLKSIEEATEIRRRVLLAFERAESTTDPDTIRRLLTFVIVGGGATGVEMAGAISELAHYTLRGDFRKQDPGTARIVLIEGGERVLEAFHPSLSAKALKSLEKMRVEVHTSARVKEITADHVAYEQNGTRMVIPTNTVIWGAGVKASPIADAVAKALNITPSRGGRIPVGPELTVAGYPDVFVIGDMATSLMANGKPLPGVAQVAMQQGTFVAREIGRRLNGNKATDTFKYFDKGNMATIGRNSAVAETAWLRLSGWIAWMAWLFIHVIYLVQFQNRAMVLLQWFGNYITRNRAARLITGERNYAPAEIPKASGT